MTRPGPEVLARSLHHANGPTRTVTAAHAVKHRDSNSSIIASGNAVMLCRRPRTQPRCLLAIAQPTTPECKARPTRRVNAIAWRKSRGTAPAPRRPPRGGPDHAAWRSIVHGSSKIRPADGETSPREKRLRASRSGSRPRIRGRSGACTHSASPTRSSSHWRISSAHRHACTRDARRCRTPPPSTQGSAALQSVYVVHRDAHGFGDSATRTRPGVDPAAGFLHARRNLRVTGSSPPTDVGTPTTTCASVRPVPDASRGSLSSRTGQTHGSAAPGTVRATMVTTTSRVASATSVHLFQVR